MVERWLPVVGWEGTYEVSDLGRIRRIAAGRGAVAGRVMGQPLTNGYPAVKLRLNGREGRHLVHRLVAVAFLGPEPFAGAQVNHKDGRRDNNRADNLEWVSCSDNHVHAYRVLGRAAVSVKGSRAGRAKLSEEQVLEIRRRYTAGEGSQQTIADDFGVSQSLVTRIVRGKNWNHI